MYLKSAIKYLKLPFTLGESKKVGHKRNVGIKKNTEKLLIIRI